MRRKYLQNLGRTRHRKTRLPRRSRETFQVKKRSRSRLKRQAASLRPR